MHRDIKSREIIDTSTTKFLLWEFWYVTQTIVYKIYFNGFLRNANISQFRQNPSRYIDMLRKNWASYCQFRWRNVSWKLKKSRTASVAKRKWNMNEWIIMRKSEKRTNENFPSEMSRLPESGLQRRTASRRSRKSRFLISHDRECKKIRK